MIIDRAKMTVCGSCASLGSAYWKAHTSRRSIRRIARPPPRVRVRKKQPVLTETLELMGDFNLRIRQARERLGLSHEDLGRKIGEKVSVLRKIESGKMHPDHKLARKLEHALKIRLLAPLQEPKPPSAVSPLPRGATLGEVAHVKGKETEVNEEREPL